jgi:hypothetical protein
MSETGTPPSEDVGPGKEIANAPPNEPPSAGRLWSFALGAGIVAGLLSWGAGELAKGAFQPRLFEVVVLQMKMTQSTTLSENAAMLKNATLAFGLLGLLSGLVSGLAGGLAGRSSVRTLIAALSGGALGGMVGVGASLALIPQFFRQLVPDPNEMLLPMLIHGGIWAPISAVAGAALAFGCGADRRILRAVVGAALGACLGTVLYHGIASTFFPESGYAEPLAATSAVRLLSRMLVTVLAALGAWRAIVSSPHRATPARSD